MRTLLSVRSVSFRITEGLKSLPLSWSLREYVTLRMWQGLQSLNRKLISTQQVPSIVAGETPVSRLGDDLVDRLGALDTDEFLIESSVEKTEIIRIET